MADGEWPSSVEGTIFRRIEWVPTVSSTNTVLMEEARRTGGEGRVLVADVQTEGKGRRGRRWIAPAGSSLMMSVLLRPPAGTLRPRQASLVTTAFAVAAIAATSDCCDVSLKLKWPNDLVVLADDGERGPGYRKVAGILTETVITDGEVSALVVGMGMNTGWRTMPEGLADQARSLDQLAGRPVLRPELMTRLLHHFDEGYRALLKAGGPAATVERATALSATVGMRVRLALGAGEVLQGVAAGLDDDGRLLLRCDDDGIRALAEGEVVHLRPDAGRQQGHLGLMP